MNSLQSMWEIDLGGIARSIWRQRLTFFLVSVTVILLAVVYLHIAKRSYAVTLQIAPISSSAQQPSGGGLSALARLGGLNLNDATGGGAQFRLFVAALKSRNTADAIARNQHLMRGLFSSQWSAEENRWKAPSSVGRTIGQAVSSAIGSPSRAWSPPSGEQVYDILDNSLEIDDDPKSPVVGLRIVSADPEVAQELLNELVHTIDAELRHRALARANDYISYLNKQLDLVTVADYRDSLLKTMSDQQEIRMMASANVTFAAQVFSGPSISSVPVSPKSTLILAFAMIGGFVLGSAAALYVDRRRGRVSSRKSVSSSAQHEHENLIA